MYAVARFSLGAILMAVASLASNCDGNCCDPISACEGNAIGDDCAFLAQGCDGGGLGRPIATGYCDDPANDPEGAGVVWCHGEW